MKSRLSTWMRRPLKLIDANKWKFWCDRGERQNEPRLLSSSQDDEQTSFSLGSLIGWRERVHFGTYILNCFVRSFQKRFFAQTQILYFQISWSSSLLYRPIELVNVRKVKLNAVAPVLKYLFNRNDSIKSASSARIIKKCWVGTNTIAKNEVLKIVIMLSENGE